MTENSIIDYHLRALKIARNPEDPWYCMPKFLPTDRYILDLGCGIGQLLVASNLDANKKLFGLDIDLSCLMYGHANFKIINYVNACADILPFIESSFDFIICSASIAYTNLKLSIPEIYRVLRTGGRLWLSLPLFLPSFTNLFKSIISLNIKKTVFYLYVILNGLAFHYFDKLYKFPFRRRYQSFLTLHAARRALSDAGFTNLEFDTCSYYTVTVLAYK